MNRERALDLLEWLGKEAKKILEEEEGLWDFEDFRQKIKKNVEKTLRAKGLCSKLCR